MWVNFDDGKGTGRVLLSAGSLVDRVGSLVDAVARVVFLLDANTKVEFLLATIEGRMVTRDEPVPMTTVGARVMVGLGFDVTVDLTVG